MQIKDNFNEVMVTELRPGQVFRYNGNLYMAIPEIEEREGLPKNCVSLENGCLSFVYPAQSVFLIDGYFQVTGC